jgi:hypothetical protein
MWSHGRVVVNAFIDAREPSLEPPSRCWPRAVAQARPALYRRCVSLRAACANSFTPAGDIEKPAPVAILHVIDADPTVQANGPRTSVRPALIVRTLSGTFPMQVCPSQIRVLPAALSVTER